MRRSFTGVLLILAAGHGLYACGAQKADAIITSGRELELVAEAPPNLDDPFGSCSVASNGTNFPFACSIEGAACGGWGGFSDCIPAEPWIGTVEGECEGSQYFTQCRHACARDSDCPHPETGSAAPVCAAAGFCQLPCEDGTDCPDGYGCELAPAGSPEFLPRICIQRFDSLVFTRPLTYRGQQ